SPVQSCRATLPTPPFPTRRSSDLTRSSSAPPLEPKRSKNADCGLTKPTRSAQASTIVSANRSAPARSSSRPQCRSTAPCGSTPTHNGTRALNARWTLAPKSLFTGKVVSSRWAGLSGTGGGPLGAATPGGAPLVAADAPPHQRGPAVDEATVDLDEAGAGVEHGLGVVGRHDAARAKDRKSTRLNSSHVKISYAVFCLKKKKTK